MDAGLSVHVEPDRIIVSQLADAYREATTRDWTQPIGVIHALFETGVAALKASGDPKDPAKVADAVRSMKLDTVIGHLDFTASGIKNVSKMRVVGGQWHLDANGNRHLHHQQQDRAGDSGAAQFELLPS